MSDLEVMCSECRFYSRWGSMVYCKFLRMEVDPSKRGDCTEFKPALGSGL